MTHEPLKQEEDRIATGRIVMIGVIALIVFAIGISWAVKIQRASTGSVRTKTGTRPLGVGQREVGMVYQSLFDATSIAREHDAPKRARLATYGFTDASHQTARIPIARAMQLVVDRGKL